MHKIITHSRFFNLDEIAAIALLDLFSLHGDYEIIRTRDEVILAAAKKDEKTYVIDVGFEYDPKMLNFDHHQKDMTKVWSDGTPYSSCGLVWEYLKEQGAINLPQKLISKFEKTFIKKVDAQDNGVKYFSEMNFVTEFNRNHHDDKFIDLKFSQALSCVKDNIEMVIMNILSDKKDIFMTNSVVSDFSDQFIAHNLLVRFAFKNQAKVNIEGRIYEYNYIHANGEDKKIVIDYDKKMIVDNGVESFYHGFATSSLWTFMIDKNMLTQSMNKETIDLMEEYIIHKFVKGTQFKEISWIMMYENSNLPLKSANSAASYFVSNVFGLIRNEINANKDLKKCIKRSESIDKIVLLDRNIKLAPRKIAEMNIGKLLVIIPRDKKSWKIQNLPTKNPILMPEKWRGLSNEKLVKASGIKELIFCHKSGFMCMFKGTKEEAIKMAKQIINH